jgi:NitT/TauT family transport system permease protein
MFRIREPVHPAIRVMTSLIPFAIGLLAWMWLTAGASPEVRRIGPTILPSPSEVLAAIPTIWFDGALTRNILLSLFRVLGGFSMACVIALPLGVMMGACTRISATFSLVMTILSYLPMPAMLPLTMAWWGSGEGQKIGFLSLVTFSMLLPLVVRAIGNVDHKYVLSAYSQGANSWKVLEKVLIPIAAPEIYGGLRLCLGVGWTYIVLAEVIKSDGDLGGVGNLIMVYHRLGHMAEAYLVVIAICIVGMGMDRGCAWLRGRLFPYIES